MTCIVAYKKNGNVYMGADSSGVAGSHNVMPRKDGKMFTNGGVLFGFTSSYRMGQLLKYKLEVPKHKSKISTDKYMNTIFIDAVIKCLESNGYSNIKENKKSGGTFLVGYKGRIFFVDNDFQVAEGLRDFNSCGSGAETAIGAMTALLKYDKEIQPKKLLTIALQSACENIATVNGKLHFKQI